MRYIGSKRLYNRKEALALLKVSNVTFWNKIQKKGFEPTYFVMSGKQLRPLYTDEDIQNYKRILNVGKVKKS